MKGNWHWYKQAALKVAMELWINKLIWYICDVTKTVAIQLPAKNKSKIWSRTIADQCSFCAERRSTAIVQDDLILAHTDCKGMPYQRVFFFEESPLFWQTCPKVKFAVSSYFYLTKKVARFSVWVHYLKKNHSDWAHVVHLSPCCMFHNNSEHKIRRRFSFFVIC